MVKAEREGRLCSPGLRQPLLGHIAAADAPLPPPSPGETVSKHTLRSCLRDRGHLVLFLVFRAIDGNAFFSI